MNGKSWVFASLFSALALATAAAAPAQADERWPPGRAQWQPPTRAGWVNAERHRDRDWNGRADWGHQRYEWWRRDHDRRWSHREEERRHEWWRRHHRHRWD